MSWLLQVAYQQLTHATTPVAVAQWLLLLVVPLLLLLHYYASQRSRSRRRGNGDGDDKVQLPPSPPGLPIIGHLHLVGGLPHVSLRDLSAKHGSSDGLMFLRLGSVPTLILSSPRAAEAILRTHDHVFASRTASTVSDDLLYGSSDIVFAPYGEHWRQIKKLATTHLFTVQKVHSYGRARKEEVSETTTTIYICVYATHTYIYNLCIYICIYR